MYEIKTINVPGNGLAVFREGKKVLEVLSYGATLNHLEFSGHSLLDGYSSLSEKETAWYKGAVLFPFPNRLRDGKYDFKGRSFQFPVNEPANQNALHGFVYKEEFELTSDLLGDKVVINGSYKYDGGYDYFPFPFLLEASYILHGDHLTVSYAIRNIGDGELPMGFGWHPYFGFPDGVDQATMTFMNCQKVVLDNRQLPTGEFASEESFSSGQHLKGVNLDTGYKMPESSWDVKVEDSNGTLVLKSDNMPYLQVYIPPHRTSIALEPMSSGIDVFNSHEGLTKLNSGDTVTYTSHVTYHKK
jgi:aldose 1-epimerase